MAFPSNPIDGAGVVTDFGWVYYTEDDTPILGIHSMQHTCNVYASADGYAVLTIYLSSSYFAGIVLDQINVDSGDIVPLRVSAATYSGSSLGVY